MLKRSPRYVADLVLRYEGVVLLVAAPFLLFPNSITPFALALLALPWLLRWWRHGFLTRRTPLDWPLALLALMAFVGARQAVDPALALPKLLGILLSLATFYTVINTTHHIRHAWLWIALLLILGLGLALLGALGADWFERKIFNLGGLYRHLPRLPEALRQRLQGGDFHPNEIAGMISLFLPLSLAMWWGAWRRSSDPAWPQRALPAERLLLTLIVAILGSVLLLTQSRSAILGLLLTAGVVALVWQWRLVVFLPVPGAGVYWLLRDSSQWLLAQPGADPANLVGRMEIWQRALLAVADFPLTGIGLGTFRRLAIAYAPFFDVDPVLADVGHAHNIFLQTALDMGIPGLVAYVAVLLLVAGMGWSLYKRTTSPTGRLLSAGLLTSLLAFHIFSLTDAVAPGAKPVFTLWMFVGMIVALGQANVIGNLPQRDLKT